MSALDTSQFINGCDAWFDGTWKACWDVHDIAYTKGGDLISKLQADWDLGVCVWNESHTNGVLMFLGTAIFGGLFFRWKWLNGKNYWEVVFKRNNK